MMAGRRRIGPKQLALLHMLAALRLRGHDG
jgi:hypothetical protein